MESGSSFGVVIACCDHDLHLAVASAESARHFMPDIPLCFVYDGSRSLQHLEECYGLTVIRKETTVARFLREHSYGFGLTKMVAFWESPFDTFLYLDSDAICWGDLSRYCALNELDILTPTMGYSYNEDEMSKWFFNANWISDFDPSFSALRFSSSYFCTGTYVARKGIFDLEWYQFLLSKQKEKPGRFLYGEMGLLNYMIFSAAQRGSLRVSSELFQYVNSDSNWLNTKKTFRFKHGLPDLSTTKSMVLHYAGPKPYVFNRRVHSTPMRFFRLRAKQRLIPGISRGKALAEILQEDYRYFKRPSAPMKSSIAVFALLAKIFLHLTKENPLAAEILSK